MKEQMSRIGSESRWHIWPYLSLPTPPAPQHLQSPQSKESDSTLLEED